MKVAFYITIIILSTSFFAYTDQAQQFARPFMAEFNGESHAYEITLDNDLSKSLLPEEACFRYGILSLSQVSPLSIVIAATPDAFKQTGAGEKSAFYQRAMGMLKAPALVLAGLSKEIHIRVPDPIAKPQIAPDLIEEADELLASYLSAHPKKRNESLENYYSRCGIDIARQILSLIGMTTLHTEFLIQLVKDNKQHLLTDQNGVPSYQILDSLVHAEQVRVTNELYNPCVQSSYNYSGSTNFFAQHTALVPGSAQCTFLLEIARSRRPGHYESWSKYAYDYVGWLLHWPASEDAYTYCQKQVETRCIRAD